MTSHQTHATPRTLPTGLRRHLALLMVQMVDGAARLLERVVTRAQRVQAEPERGDVPGWVMVTLMTAGLVAMIWLLADDWLRQLFQQAVDRVSGP